jgi:hypothetical protein
LRAIEPLSFSYAEQDARRQKTRCSAKTSRAGDPSDETRTFHSGRLFEKRAVIEHVLATVNGLIIYKCLLLIKANLKNFNARAHGGEVPETGFYRTLEGSTRTNFTESNNLLQAAAG